MDISGYAVDNGNKPAQLQTTCRVENDTEQSSAPAVSLLNSVIKGMFRFSRASFIRHGVRILNAWQSTCLAGKNLGWLSNDVAGDLDNPEKEHPQLSTQHANTISTPVQTQLFQWQSYTHTPQFTYISQLDTLLRMHPQWVPEDTRVCMIPCTRVMQIHMLQRRYMSIICKNAVFMNIRAQAIHMLP